MIRIQKNAYRKNGRRRKKLIREKGNKQTDLMGMNTIDEGTRLIDWLIDGNTDLMGGGKEGGGRIGLMGEGGGGGRTGYHAKISELCWWSLKPPGPANETEKKKNLK